MDMKKQPGISIAAIMLMEEKFKRVKSIPKQLDVNVDFSLKHEKILKTNKANITITTKVTGNSKELIKETNSHIAYELEFDFIGVFSVVSGEENMELDNFVKHNAAAIMIPYIREHISSTTQKSGLGSVYLKPLNIMALFSEKNAMQETE